MSRELKVDKLNIRLPAGWQGDASSLARQIAEQVQRQAADLNSTERIDLTLRGPYAGNARAVATQVAEQLAAYSRDGKGRRGR